ncbi:MAG: hypothetical protein U0800_10475 [Isosphaeraceae bacterium]
MLMRQEYAVVEHGTSAEFIEAAVLRVRLAARRYQLMGIPKDVVRRVILDRFRESIEADFNAWSFETLMAFAARTLDHEIESCPKSGGPMRR